MKVLTPTAASLYAEIDSSAQALVQLMIAGYWEATHPGQRAPAGLMTPTQARARRRINERYEKAKARQAKREEA